VGIQPLTDDGLYDLLDALGLDTSHRARERAQLERRVLELDLQLEAAHEALDSVEESLRITERENEVLKARLKMVKSATADA
jgi:hypothetical protein